LLSYPNDLYVVIKWVGVVGLYIIGLLLIGLITGFGFGDGFTGFGVGCGFGLIGCGFTG